MTEGLPDFMVVQYILDDVGFISSTVVASNLFRALHLSSNPVRRDAFASELGSFLSDWTTRTCIRSRISTEAHLLFGPLRQALTTL